MQITRIQAKYFRCFTVYDATYNAPIILLEGQNGAGKTSLLEILHFGCYLRSFRTHRAKDLIAFDQKNFFIKISFTDVQQLEHQITIGFDGTRKLVKLDQKPIKSYKQLMDQYRIITLTEDDMLLIKGGPETRRSFIDQAILLQNPSFITSLRAHKKITLQRNAFLHQSSLDHEQYLIWTKKLYVSTCAIQAERIALLALLQMTTNQLVTDYFKNEFAIDIEYKSAKLIAQDSFENFLEKHPRLMGQESISQRSLFGAHLDDFDIRFADKNSRTFASRGQQKLTIVLLKIAQIKQTLNLADSAIFLLDDYMTDFDINRATTVLKILIDLPIQLIFTSPNHTGPFEEKLRSFGAVAPQISI